jgi:hypothetical protein
MGTGDDCTRPLAGTHLTMGVPIDDEPLEPTDDTPVTEPAQSDDLAAPDPEAPAADALDQEREVASGWRIGRRSSDPEAPDADALDQAIVVPTDDEDRRD